MRLSKYFELNKKTQRELDFVDIDLIKDTELFIDPWLIKGKDTDFSQESTHYLQSYFEELLKNIHKKNEEKSLELLNHLHEVDWTRLGYSKKGVRGKAIAKEHASQIYNALKQSKAVETEALKDIEDTALLIPGIDRDKISDMVTNVIMPILVTYTHEQSRLHGIPFDKKPLRWNFWNSVHKKWEVSVDFHLPSYDGKPILLVPKAIVSANLLVNSEDFYNKYILTFEQQRHLNNPSLGLCRVLKDNTYKPPTKKTLKKLIPYSNNEIIKYINEHSELLSSYKRDLKRLGKVKNPRKYKTQDQLIVSRNTGIKDASLNTRVEELIKELASIRPGKEDAYKYHKLVAGILTLLFGESLTNVKIEDPLSGGTKFVDLSFLNIAEKGFFLHCGKLNIPSRKIYFECKNYTEDVANNELDQLLGRFGVNTSRIGFIVCRTLTNRNLFIKRCGHEVGKNRNYVLVLTDDDLVLMLNNKVKDEQREIDDFLDQRLEEINSYLSKQ